MSIFDDLINPYSKHSEQEWDKIIWDEFLKISQDQFVINNQYSYWFYYPVPLSSVDVSDALTGLKIPAKFRSKTGFKKWMKSQRVHSLNNDIIECFDKAFSNILNKYYVGFRLHIEFDKQGVISKLKFKHTI